MRRGEVAFKTICAADEGGGMGIKMKKKSVLALSSVLALLLAFTIFTTDADALSRRDNDKRAKGQTARASMSQIGQNDDDFIVSVRNEARARRRFSNETRTTATSTNCVRWGYAGSRDKLDRGFRNCLNCTQDPEHCVPALDGSGNQYRKQENNRFESSGNPDAKQKGKQNNGSGNRSGKQENRRFNGSGNPDAGQADRPCDASECLNPDCTATPKRDGTGSRNRGNSTN